MKFGKFWGQTYKKSLKYLQDKGRKTAHCVSWNSTKYHSLNDYAFSLIDEFMFIDGHQINIESNVSVRETVVCHKKRQFKREFKNNKFHNLNTYFISTSLLL